MADDAAFKRVHGLLDIGVAPKFLIDKRIKIENSGKLRKLNDKT